MISAPISVRDASLATTYMSFGATGINISTGVTFKINGVEYMATKTTDNLNVETTNKYYLTALFNTDLATKNTTNLTEKERIYIIHQRDSGLILRRKIRIISE